MTDDNQRSITSFTGLLDELTRPEEPADPDEGTFDLDRDWHRCRRIVSSNEYGSVRVKNEHYSPRGEAVFSKAKIAPRPTDSRGVWIKALGKRGKKDTHITLHFEHDAFLAMVDEYLTALQEEGEVAVGGGVIEFSGLQE